MRYTFEQFLFIEDKLGKGKYGTVILLRNPKKQYLKRRAHGGCFLIFKIISRHYKKSDSIDPEVV